MRPLALLVVLACPALSLAGEPDASKLSPADLKRLAAALDAYQRDQADARARAAIAVAQGRRKPPQSVLTPSAAPTPKKAGTAGSPCPCGCRCRDCNCVDGECGGPNCACPDSRNQITAYSAAYDRAVREGKPLLVWVREVCPPCEAKMPQYVHAHVNEYHGVTNCCVIVARPDGQGALDLIATLAGIPTAEEVKAVLTPKAAPQAQPMQYAPAPPMQMMPPMMMGGFGGFGGGFGGGGGC